MTLLEMPAHYYKQFDADFELDQPAEGFQGWCKEQLPFHLKESALVIMHAWDCGTREQFPGMHHVVEYLPRAEAICRHIFPDLLKTARNAGLKVIHVVSQGEYYQQYPGTGIVEQIAGVEPPPPQQIKETDVWKEIRKFKTENSIPGKHNQESMDQCTQSLRFPDEVQPDGNEDVVSTSHQLFQVCKFRGINHLIYTGFAINWCLLHSPGGMIDMSRHGILCSTIREAVTAVENKQTAREQLQKELALWRVAVRYGLVYDIDDFKRTLEEMEGDE